MLALVLALSLSAGTECKVDDDCSLALSCECVCCPETKVMSRSRAEAHFQACRVPKKCDRTKDCKGKCPPTPPAKAVCTAGRCEKKALAP